MSPAKRKPKSSPRARPAARASSNGAKREACGLQPLAAAYDGEADRARLLAHIPGCDSCSDQLEVIAVERETLGFLGDTEVAPAGISAQAAVRRLLEQTAASGRAKLADLVYELSKACLFAADELDARLRRDVEPRAFGVVRRECDATMSRLESAPRGALPDTAAGSTDVARARRTARSCQLILDQLEGETPRCVLLDSLVLIAERKHAEAEKCLRALLDRPLSADERRFALMNLMWACIRQQRYAEAVATGTTGMDSYPDEWMFVYNVAVACSYSRDIKEFDAVAKLVRSRALNSKSAEFVQLLKREAPRFAMNLGLSSVEVLVLFGLPVESKEVSSL